MGVGGSLLNDTEKPFYLGGMLFMDDFQNVMFELGKKHFLN